MALGTSQSLDGIAFPIGKTVTLSDSVDLPNGPALILVCGPSSGTGSSNVQITDADGNISVHANVPDYSVLRVKAKRVWSTNTTASNLCIALYG